MAAHNYSTIKLIQMNQTWKDCGLPLAAYKLVKLPRGDAFSHQEFTTDYKHRLKGYQKKKSDETLEREAKEELARKEAKLMSTKEESFVEFD